MSMRRPGDGAGVLVDEDAHLEAPLLTAVRPCLDPLKSHPFNCPNSHISNASPCDACERVARRVGHSHFKISIRLHTNVRYVRHRHTKFTTSICYRRNGRLSHLVAARNGIVKGPIHRACRMATSECHSDNRATDPHPRLLSIALHAASRSLTASTLTWSPAFALSSSAISITCSTPPAPITTGTPT